jgi:cytochrome c oxidase subunit IV
MEFHDDYPQYEVMSNHSEAEGKPIRRKLWNVFWIMLGVTIVELLIGTYASSMGLLDSERRSSMTLKIIFVVLTILKAGYIVMVFMHLGHEVKFFKWTILAPYITFICYLVFIILVEGTYVGIPANRTPTHKQYIDNRNATVERLNAHDKGGHEGAATEGHKDAEKSH